MTKKYSKLTSIESQIKILIKKKDMENQLKIITKSVLVKTNSI